MLLSLHKVSMWRKAESYSWVHLRVLLISELALKKDEVSTFGQYWNMWKYGSKNWTVSSKFGFVVLVFFNNMYSDITSARYKTIKWFSGWILFVILKMLQIRWSHFKACNSHKAYFVLNNLMFFFDSQYVSYTWQYCFYISVYR